MEEINQISIVNKERMDERQRSIYFLFRKTGAARGQQSSNIYTKKARQTRRGESLNFTQYIVLYFFNKLIFSVLIVCFVIVIYI